MSDKKTIQDFWNNFLHFTNRETTLNYYFCGCFGPTEDVANTLVELIQVGTKTATTSCLLAYHANNEPLPKIGDLSIVTDWNGSPKCVIETTVVTVLPFKDVTFDICKREGEDDTIQSWQSTHFKIFTNEGKQVGYAFTWDTPVVFEDFIVIYQ